MTVMPLIRRHYMMGDLFYNTQAMLMMLVQQGVIDHGSLRSSKQFGPPLQ
jgi:hypothetical protein